MGYSLLSHCMPSLTVCLRGHPTKAPYQGVALPKAEAGPLDPFLSTQSALYFLTCPHFFRLQAKCNELYCQEPYPTVPRRDAVVQPRPSSSSPARRCSSSCCLPAPGRRSPWVRHTEPGLQGPLVMLIITLTSISTCELLSSHQRKLF